MTGNPRTALAAVLLFTTPPSDRALKGWHLDKYWLGEELKELDMLGGETACQCRTTRTDQSSYT